jgi:hypothetical protein
MAPALSIDDLVAGKAGWANVRRALAAEHVRAPLVSFTMVVAVPAVGMAIVRAVAAIGTG